MDRIQLLLGIVHEVINSGEYSDQEVSAIASCTGNALGLEVTAELVVVEPIECACRCPDCGAPIEHEKPRGRWYLAKAICKFGWWTLLSIFNFICSILLEVIAYIWLLIRYFSQLPHFLLQLPWIIGKGLEYPLSEQGQRLKLAAIYGKSSRNPYDYGSWQYSYYDQLKEFGYSPIEARDAINYRWTRPTRAEIRDKQREKALDRVGDTHEGLLAEKPARGRNQRDRVRHDPDNAHRASQSQVLPRPEDQAQDQTGWNNTAEDTFTPPEIKCKAKSRHVCQHQRNAIDSLPSEDDSDTLPPPELSLPITIAVNPSSRTLFLKMLTSQRSSKSPVPFSELVAAMVDAGFTAEQGGVGSAVKFTRHDVGSISFHRPHPDPRIRYNELRKWGRRMRKDFGWDEETFVVREA